MHKYTQVNGRSKRGSLFRGLVLILVISSCEVVADCFEYYQVSIWEDAVRDTRHLGAFRSSQEESISAIGDSQRRILLNILTHSGTMIIAMWCLSDAARTTGLAVES